MSTTDCPRTVITDETLEAAARRLVSDEFVLCHRHSAASDDDTGHLLCPICLNCAKVVARAALEAAAPLIAAQAWEEGYAEGSRGRMWDSLNPYQARANQIEAGR